MPVKTPTKTNGLILLLLLVIALLFAGIKKCNKSNAPYSSNVNTTAGDWRHHKLIYTKHARCRMDCREITEEEVEQILAAGTINEGRSKEADEEAKGNCPTFALEGKTSDGQQVRIVFGACEKITKVITAIDLGAEHTCNCR